MVGIRYNSFLPIERIPTAAAQRDREHDQPQNSA
jgi:hypothetical protein